MVAKTGSIIILAGVYHPGRAGPGTCAGLRARRLRAISAFELWGLDAARSLPASEVAARAAFSCELEAVEGEDINVLCSPELRESTKQ